MIKEPSEVTIKTDIRKLKLGFAFLCTQNAYKILKLHSWLSNFWPYKLSLFFLYSKIFERFQNYILVGRSAFTFNKNHIPPFVRRTSLTEQLDRPQIAETQHFFYI